MASKKKKAKPQQSQHDEQELEEEFQAEEELGVSEGDDYHELVLDRDEAEELLAKIKKLQKKLKDQQKEKEEYLDGWQRNRAELAKIQQGKEEEIKEAKAKARRGVITEFLPALDSFDMAFANQEAWQQVDENWRKGVEYIHAQFLSALEREGVSEINPEEGERFDPASHEPLETVSVEASEWDNAILGLVQKGYAFHSGDVIRPAKVKVGKLADESDEASSEDG